MKKIKPGWLLGSNQRILLKKLESSPVPATAGGLSGTDMSPEMAAATLRRLERLGYVMRTNRRKRAREISTFTTTWIITSTGAEALIASAEGLLGP